MCFRICPRSVSLQTPPPPPVCQKRVVPGYGFTVYPFNWPRRLIARPPIVQPLAGRIHRNCGQVPMQPGVVAGRVLPGNARAFHPVNNAFKGRVIAPGVR